MLVLERKEGKRGEIKIVLFESDKVQMYVNGLNWININQIINDFNTDPKINDLWLSATYAGDIDPEVFEKYIEKSSEKHDTEVKSDKKKVHSDGSEEDDEDDEDEDEDNNPSEVNSELKERLKDTVLRCDACGEEGKALVDKDGKIHHCESCIKIDAYLKGKKEGFDDGYDKGYHDVLVQLSKICDNIDDNKLKQILNEKDNKDEKEKH